MHEQSSIPRRELLTTWRDKLYKLGQIICESHVQTSYNRFGNGHELTPRQQFHKELAVYEHLPFDTGVQKVFVTEGLAAAVIHSKPNHHNLM